MIRQAFGAESMSRTRKVQTHRDRKRRVGRWRAKSRACSSFSSISQRIRPGRPNSQFHTLLRLRENVRRLRPELWRKKKLAIVSGQRTISLFLFNSEFFTKNNMTVVPTNWRAAIFTQNRRRCWTRLPGRIYKMAEALGTEGRWWSVRTKLVSDRSRELSVTL
jgi:hypothetical protein